MSDEARIEIRCDLATLHKSARGSITANLEAVIGGFVFPGAGWSDFVAVVLGWWLRALRELIRGAASVELGFMDGPFVIRITKHQPAHYIVACCEYRAERRVLLQARVDALQLLSETERAAARVLEACVARKWDAPALRSLAMQLEEQRH